MTSGVAFQAVAADATKNSLLVLAGLAQWIERRPEN